MIWIVSKKVCDTQEHLDRRHRYIEQVTKSYVSPWVPNTCKYRKDMQDLSMRDTLDFYSCKSYKGEYGVVITAHTPEVPSILSAVLSNKRAIVVINSCVVYEGKQKDFLKYIYEKNQQSKLFYAKQDINKYNYVDNFGCFGFETSKSERMLFKHKENGLIKAIEKSYDHVCDLKNGGNSVA